MGELVQLYAHVTSAILRAESMAPGSPEAERAFREVSQLEEQIAAMTDAESVSGEVARIGAVTAALSAGKPLRARQLAKRFLTEELHPPVRARLESLVAE